ncbi:MAG TPA: 2OG-Fe(II) oxygenase [Chloroflexota bacterium]|nr:2OG-Fe(II) oxygenase [Chloroflexota bacterium]
MAATYSEERDGPALLQQIDALPWDRIASDLDTFGAAPIPPLLDSAQCMQLIALFGDDARFRKRIDMGQHAYGEGEYKYFTYPLPPLVQALRVGLYRHLAPIGNRWATALGTPTRYADSLADFLDLCASAGQTKPTPLMLHYGPGGYNCLHQDLYGAVAFPLQVVFALSDPGRDYTGGDVLLVEQRPRAQSRGDSYVLARGAGLVFTTRYRPVAGRRGSYRVNVRHGVSRIRTGERFTLGIIFHDAA